MADLGFVGQGEVWGCSAPQIWQPVVRTHWSGLRKNRPVNERKVTRAAPVKVRLAGLVEGPLKALSMRCRPLRLLIA